MNEIVIKEHTIYEDFLTEKDLTVVDLGACRGEFIMEIDRIYSVKKAIVVEPNPTNFAYLIRKHNFMLMNKAVTGGADKTVAFREDVDSPYNGSLIFDYFSNAKVHTIETITLSEIVSMFDGEIDLLKIDIEGSEYDLLTNAKDKDLLRFKQITVEFHDFVDASFKEKNKEIEARMLSLGFKVTKKGIQYRENSDYYDTLFYKN